MSQSKLASSKLCGVNFKATNEGQAKVNLAFAALATFSASKSFENKGYFLQMYVKFSPRRRKPFNLSWKLLMRAGCHEVEGVLLIE